MAKRKKNNNIYSLIAFLFFLLVLLFNNYLDKKEEIPIFYDISEITPYDGEHDFVYLNDNKPYFTEYTTREFEEYSPLDELGRCGTAFANISINTMPTEERGEIGMIKPSGWHTIKYDIVDGKYLYNRCHLIAFQLAGENANPKNLITCTRQMNVGAMLDFENLVATYVKKTKNHVMYRVTPIYKEHNLVADGVIMEAYSVEDNGKGISFNVFVYNIQSGIIINYETGESELKE